MDKLMLLILASTVERFEIERCDPDNIVEMPSQANQAYAIFETCKRVADMFTIGTEQRSRSGYTPEEWSIFRQVSSRLGIEQTED